MFNISITDTDKFLDMPATSQNLYFHLNMHADDDGFVDSPKRIMRNVSASQDDMNILLSKQFVFVFESGVLVIRDWKIHNIIRKDTYKPTLYQQEKSSLEVTKTGAYQFRNEPVTETGETVAQNRIDKIRLDKIRLGKMSADENRQADNQLKEISDYYQQEIGVLTPNQLEQLSDYLKEDAFEKDVIKRAIDKAANSAKRSFGYINGILRDWKQNGIKTLVQVEEEQQKFMKSKHLPKNNTEDLHNVVDPDFGF